MRKQFKTRIQKYYINSDIACFVSVNMDILHKKGLYTPY